MFDLCKRFWIRGFGLNYIFISQKESHSFPDILMENCDHSICPFWSILFSHTPAHRTWILKKLILTFLITDMGIMVLKIYFIIYGEIDLFITILNSNYRLEIWWHYQKIHVTLITILVLFERYFQASRSCNVSYLGLNCFKNCYGWPFRPPAPGYLLPKKPRMVRVMAGNIW